LLVPAASSLLLVPAALLLLVVVELALLSPTLRSRGRRGDPLFVAKRLR
jgi:hypothetical protein